MQKASSLLLVQEERFQALEKKMDTLATIIEKQREEQFLNRWIEGTKVPKHLNISTRTWQKYRNAKVIPFSQYGRQIWVKLADIENFLLDNHIKSAA